MLEFFRNLFNTDGFPPRWYCGHWTAGHGWLHICSDIATFLAYLTIPFVIVFFLRKRRDIPFPRLFYWFAAFIFACGTVHLIEAIIFWSPVYRLSGVFKCITAIVSWGTLGAVIRVAPQALSMRSSDEMQREIDERVRVESVLRESEDRYRSLFDSTSDMVVSLDANAGILFANPAWLQTLGYESSELTSLSMYDVIADEHHNYFLRTLQDLVSGRKVGTIDLVFVAKDGRRVWVEGKASTRFVDGTFAAIHGFFQDVSQRKAAEDRLVNSERLSAIGQAMTGLIHESRNALARSQAGLKLLSREVDRSPTAMKFIEEALQAQRDVQHLFEEVRHYAVPAQLNLSTLRIDMIAQTAWNQVVEACGRQELFFSQHFADVDTQCAVDEIAIRNVFRNLFENSIAACSGPANILLRYKATRLNGADGLEILVSDDGPGLGDVDSKQAFEPFFTTKTEGTGLGLAISKQTIERHRGTIDLSPIGNKGAEFIIKIPRDLK